MFVSFSVKTDKILSYIYLLLISSDFSTTWLEHFSQLNDTDNYRKDYIKISFCN